MAARICGPEGSSGCADAPARFAGRSAGKGTTGLIGMLSRITETTSHFSAESSRKFNAEQLRHKVPEVRPRKAHEQIASRLPANARPGHRQQESFGAPTKKAHWTFRSSCQLR